MIVIATKKDRKKIEFKKIISKILLLSMLQLNKEILNALQHFEDQFEHEFRFGKYRQDQQTMKFTPGVSQEEFDRILRFISSFAKFKGSSFSHTVCFPENYRKRTTFKENTGDSFLVNPETVQDPENFTEEFVVKKKVNNFDLVDYNTRFSVSHEIVAPLPEMPGEEIYFKNMKRLTYQYGPFQIDFSLSTKGRTPSSSLNFDVEVEILSKVSGEEVSHFIGNILKALQNEKFLLKINEKNEVLKAYKHLVKSSFYFGCQPLPLKAKLSGEYSVSLKLDGVRKLLFVFQGKVFSLDSKNKVIFTGETAKDFDGSVFDSELYQGIYYVFDAIFDKSLDLRQQTSVLLKKRLELVKAFAKYSGIVPKEHHFPAEGNVVSTCKKLLSSKEFKNDGLIFTPISANYPLNAKDLGAVPLKWKKAEDNTIDFQLKQRDNISWDLTVVAESGKLCPFQSRDHPDVSTIGLTIEQKKTFTDDTIVECSFNIAENSFEIVRARPDKTKPNHISVAMDNFSLIINPFELEDLESSLKPRQTSYFFDMRRFHNYIKRLLLDTYSVKNGKGGHLDLACGKGGDIYKWGDTSIRYVQGYDICPDSVAEAKRRNEKFVEKPIYKNMDYNFIVKDLTKELIETGNVFDSASCFFAIHYFFKDQASFYNAMKNTKQLKIGGHFMVSCFCSDQLEKAGYSIENSRFKIIPSTSKEDGKFGRKLDVFLEDTVLDEQTTEYVVDYPFFIKTMETLGFQLVETKLFEEYYQNWQKNNNSLNGLSKMFSFLNRAFVFVKVAESDFKEPSAVQVKSFDFSDFSGEIDFCDDTGLEEENLTRKTDELKNKKIQELKEIASTLGITFDKKITKKSLLEAILASKKY